MRVYITVDVELWPDDWHGYRSAFSRNYDRYILGKTAGGDYGLPYQLDLLKRHDLKAVFFVETLFACEFGTEPLRETVAMIQSAGQQVQLHAHPEWIAHMQAPLFDTGGRYLLEQFNVEEQSTLIRVARENLLGAGADEVFAFRSGSFSANRDTFQALRQNGLNIDSSVNIRKPNHRTEFGNVLTPTVIDGVLELPLTVYQDWPGHCRQLQVAASSYGEFKNVIRSARDMGMQDVVILSHSAELLDAKRGGVDRIVARRFEKMCRYLDGHRQHISTEHISPTMEDRGLRDGNSMPGGRWFATINRLGQQAVRRVVY